MPNMNISFSPDEDKQLKLIAKMFEVGKIDAVKLIFKKYVEENSDLLKNFEAGLNAERELGID